MKGIILNVLLQKFIGTTQLGIMHVIEQSAD